MKNRLLIAAVLISVSSGMIGSQALDHNGMYVIDSMKAVVFTEGGTEIATLSDTLRPALTGAIRSLQDIVFELTAYLEAQKMPHCVPDDDAIDRGFADLQRAHNMTLDDLKEIFKTSGYTYEEGRQQFRIMQAVNALFEYTILSNLIVTKADVEKYYNENPVHTEAQYCLQYAHIPFDKTFSKQEQYDRLKEQIVRYPSTISFGKPFWVAHHTIDKNKDFIFTLEPNEIADPYQGKTGFEIYRLDAVKPAQLKPLAERYAEIVNTLKRPRYLELLDAYKKKLEATSSVLYFP